MTTALLTFSSDEIDIQYKETFLTDALNRKLAGVVPVGIYRGFFPATHASPDFVTVGADPSGSGHVAVVENVVDRSTTIRREGGNFGLDLSAIRALTAIPTVWVITIWAKYEQGKTTGAVIRAYTEADYQGATEKDTLIVLGRVTLQNTTPAVIAADAISTSGRMSAWLQEQPERRAWQPLILNGDFEGGHTDAAYVSAIPHWGVADGAHSEWRPVTTEALYGTACLELNALSTSSISGVPAQQTINRSANPGTRVRVRYAYKVIGTLASGEVRALLEWSNGTNTTIGAMGLSAVTAGWVTVDEIVETPVGATAIKSFSTQPVAAVADSVGPVVRIDGVQVWVASEGVADLGSSRSGGVIEVEEARFTGALASQRGSDPILRRKTPGTLTLEVSDDTLSPATLDIPGSIAVGDDLVWGSFADKTRSRITNRYYDQEDTAPGDTLTLVHTHKAYNWSRANIRIYIDDLGRTIRTYNAEYTALNTWERDTNDFEATRTVEGGRDSAYTERAAANNTTSITWGPLVSRLHSGEHYDGVRRDFSSLKEFTETDLTGAAPYTANFNPNGASGVVRIVSPSATPNMTEAYGGIYAYIESVNYEGWYFAAVSAEGNLYVDFQLTSLVPGPAVFPSSGAVSLRFFKGVDIGGSSGIGTVVWGDAPDGGVPFRSSHSDSSHSGGHFAASTYTAGVADTVFAVAVDGSITSEGDATIEGDITATAGDIIASDGNLTALGDGSVDGLVKGEAFEYNTPPTRTHYIGLASGIGVSGDWFPGSSPGNQFTYTDVVGGNNRRVHFPIDLPTGAVLQSIVARVHMSSSNATEADRIRIHAAQYTNADTGNEGVNLGSAYIPNTASTWLTLQLTSIGHTIDNSLYSYMVFIESAAVGSSTLANLYITYEDPGPRNH